MNKGGIGVGSASIVLVFAVLCLTVFSLITFVVASNDKTLVEREAALVSGFFEADALAEGIVAEMLISDTIPTIVQGIDIHTELDFYTDAQIVAFSVPVIDELAIFVRLMIYFDTYEILNWHMYNLADWTYDGGLNVWAGPPGIDLGDDGFGFGSGNPWEAR
ncbi:MAG: hypothetical protein FWC66_02680 [Oscillospiraceae bacterium]|nr:hypothetical protein [Oscillospiraceae bacterium]